MFVFFVGFFRQTRYQNVLAAMPQDVEIESDTFNPRLNLNQTSVALSPLEGASVTFFVIFFF